MKTIVHLFHGNRAPSAPCLLCGKESSEIDFDGSDVAWLLVPHLEKGLEPNSITDTWCVNDPGLLAAALVHFS